MISREFHTAIDKWIKADTWYTGHPSDDERFHQLLFVVESEGAGNFDVEGFIDVASELAKRHHANMRDSFLSQSVHEKALQIEAIMNYVAYRSRQQI
jgi:hypothetical protein